VKADNIIVKDKIKKESIPLIIILIGGVFLRTLFIDTSYAFWDEAVYLENAKLFAFGESNYNELDYRPPLVSFLISPLFNLNNSELYIRSFMVLLNSLTIVAIYFFIKELYGKKCALIGALFLAILPFHIIYSQYVMTDSLLALFITILLLFMIKFKKEKSVKYLVYVGIFSALAFMTKFTAISIIPIILFPFLIKIKKKDVLLIILSSLIVILPYLLFQYFTYGNFTDFLFEAIKHVSKPEPVRPDLFLWWYIDLFGPLLLPFIFGIIILIKKKDYMPLYWGFTLFLLILFITNQGVDKPPDMLWLTERFLLPIVPFILIISSRALSDLPFKKITLFLILCLIFYFSLYQRYLQPAITLEDGVRGATKEMALYIGSNIDENAIIHCNFNCPTLAYYMPQKVEWSYDKSPTVDYLVVFDDIEAFSDYRALHSVSDGNRTVHLLNSI